jgi:hypothetical protein
LAPDTTITLESSESSFGFIKIFNEIFVDPVIGEIVIVHILPDPTTHHLDIVDNIEYITSNHEFCQTTVDIVGKV